MNRQTPLLIVSWIVAGICLFWFGSLFISFHGCDILPDWGLTTGDKIQAAIACLTLVLAVVGGLQLRDNRETSKRQLRAYIKLDIEFPDPVPGVPYPINFVCINKGQTVAKDIAFRGGIWLVPDGDPCPMISDGFDENRGHIFPGDPDANRKFETNSKSVFSAEDIKKAELRTHFFVVGLRVRYADIFDELHLTEEFWILGRDKRHLIANTSRLT